MNNRRLNRSTASRLEARLLAGLALVALLMTSLTACGSLTPAAGPAPAPTATTGPASIATPLPPPSETLIDFQVQAPAGSNPEDAVYLVLLDEVTGLALNTQVYPMSRMEVSGPVTASLPTYQTTLPFAVGSLIKYRYERQAGGVRVGEHLPDGEAVRYRLFVVDGPGAVQDVVSRWTDTPFSGPTGRILGQAMDAATGAAIPNLLVAAAGAQTLTASDGSFRLEGLPAGVHNLVGYALDGIYRPFQQGANVAADASTPAPIQLETAPLVKVVFVARPPQDTPPVVPLRLAGDLLQLGNSFATLNGGMNSLAGNMPTLNMLPDGRYTISLNLPVGADIRYKYTLGDGYWNAEHTQDGAFRLRQLIVPDHVSLVEDEIETWHAGGPPSITFDVYVPSDTPPGDFVAIQFAPLFGWTEPIPMWPLGNNRWAYALYSPLDLPGNFNYRYCRNGQCGYADDIQTPGLYGPGRPVKIAGEALDLQDSVSAWAEMSPESSQAAIPTVTVTARGPNFAAGIEFQPIFHPSWRAGLMEAPLDEVQLLGANWLVLSPTWSFQPDSPGGVLPVLAPDTGHDALWPDLVATIQGAQARGLKVALHPAANFPNDPADWWSTAPRDDAWWQVWFEQYQAFAIHHADLAAQNGAPLLILGGEWVGPALPGGTLPDGTPSGAPGDAETRWSNLLTEVRAHFSGQIAWDMPHDLLLDPPAILDQVDLVYLTLTYTPALGEVEGWLDYTVMPFQFIEGKPILLAVSVPSTPDVQTQVDSYQALLSGIASREWINGLIATGYYPPVALRDGSASVHGKPAEELLRHWFTALTASP